MNLMWNPQGEILQKWNLIPIEMSPVEFYN